MKSHLEAAMDNESGRNQQEKGQENPGNPIEVTTTGPVYSPMQEGSKVETRNRACQAEKADGTRCSVATLPASNFCFFHDPSQSSKRSEAQALGGRQNRIKTLGEEVPDVKVRDRREVATLLVQTINQVRTGRIDPRVATTIGYLGNILMTVVKQDELERRIQQLEAMSNPRRVQQ
jgi:hypothetical protein